ncbi:DnaD domain protein [Anaerobacillus sp. MEB173]|uniref:DnaD domain protein n=1 Tax=Anaerobacillus sp. MEB173 TaxID=3383345 RepID=UPI003F8E531A
MSTEIEKILKVYKSVSPEELLMSKVPGAKVPKEDVQLINTLRKMGLRDEVINVLLDYVLMTTNMKLPKPYVEKIAGHWTRKKLKTAEQAMEFAKSEHQIIQEYHKRKEQNTKINKNKIQAIEDAVKNREMSDEQLGKFVRTIFLQK